MDEASFINETVAEHSLPSAASMDFEALAPTYARTLIIEWSAIWGFVIAVAVGINFIPKVDMRLFDHWWIYLPLILIAASVFLWAPVVVRSRGFALRERDIHYKSGIIWQKTVSLPFNRIQHVELESGPLERIFKLNTLKFFTAGGSTADMKIPALQFDRASKLRTYVIKKAAVSEAADIPINEAEANEKASSEAAPSQTTLNATGQNAEGNSQ